MSARKLIGAMIASPAGAACVTWEYWAGEHASWHGWLVINGTIVAICWLALIGAAVAYSERKPR